MSEEKTAKGGLFLRANKSIRRYPCVREAPLMFSGIDGLAAYIRECLVFWIYLLQ